MEWRALLKWLFGSTDLPDVPASEPSWPEVDRRGQPRTNEADVHARQETQHLLDTYSRRLNMLEAQYGLTRRRGDHRGSH